MTFSFFLSQNLIERGVTKNKNNFNVYSNIKFDLYLILRGRDPDMVNNDYNYQQISYTAHQIFHHVLCAL